MSEELFPMGWTKEIKQLRSRVEELMDSNYKWQEKCGDLERENEKLHSLMEELEMMIRARDATIKEMRIERGRLNHAVNEELARLREQVRWIPVEERLPEIDEEVLTWDGEMYLLIIFEDVEQFIGNYGIEAWMPLPIPPEVE